MNHTKEPWIVSYGYADNGAGFVSIVSSFSGESIVGEYGPTEEDAIRIVACVNACSGSSTDWLRGYGDMLSAADCAKPFQQNIRDLAAQRDELLAALKELIDRGEFYSSAIELPRDLSGADLYYKYKALISKCEAQS